MITCTFEDGGKAAFRHVVADALVVRENEILLVRRAAFLSEGGKWALPGGYMNRDERVQDCALREAQEEAGWKCTVDRLFAVVDNPERGDDRQNVGFIFIVTPVEEVQKPDHEVSELKWFPLDALPASAEIAFDHETILAAYKQYREEETPLPVFI